MSLLLMGKSFADDPALTINSQSSINLNDHFYYLIDKSGGLTIDEIRHLSLSKFKAMNGEILRLDLTDDHVWLKVDVKSDLKERQDFIIEFSDPSLFSIEFYEMRVDKTHVFKSGTSTPQHLKAVSGNKNNFKVSIQSNEKLRLYFRISSKSSMTLSAVIQSQQQAHEKYSGEKFLLGAFYGTILLLLIYSVILFTTTKQTIFLWYGAYILSVAAFTGAADGLFPQYFHGFVNVTDGYHDILFFLGSNVLGLVFLTKFLNVRAWNQRVFNLLSLYVLILSLAVGILFLVSKPLMFQTVQVLGLVTLVVYIAVGSLAVKKRIDQALYYLIAYCAFGAFIIIFLLSQFRLISFSWVVQYSIHFGYAFSIIILSYGLIQRLNFIYHKTLFLEKEKKQIIADKNKELELKVAERTAAITKKEINLRSILDNTDNSIWLIDKSYHLIDFNRIFAILWQKSFGVKVKRDENILDFIPSDPQKKIWQRRYDFGLGGKTETYVDTYKVGEATHHFEIRGFPIRDGETVNGVAFFAKDITARLHDERQLKTQNEMLKKVNKELDSFVYSASHDLKAPLASLLGLINLVKKESSLDSRLQYYEMMEKSVVRLDRFIKDIIDYSRNERTELKYDIIDISEVIESVFEELKFVEGAQEIKKKISIKENDQLKSDDLRIRVVIRNLVSNAIRYGCAAEQSKKQIDITVIINETEAVIKVKDYGSGIADRHQDHIFKMFYRASERSSGTGLGLYIVKETLDKLQGTVELKSLEEKGTEFTVKVPNRT